MHTGLVLGTLLPIKIRDVFVDIHNNQHPLPSNQAWIYYVGPKAIVETDNAESLGLKEMDVVEARAYIV